MMVIVIAGCFLGEDLGALGFAAAITVVLSHIKRSHVGETQH